MKFDYQGARQEGYTDDEIISFLQEQNPNFDYQGARQEGYNVDEIVSFLTSEQPEKPKDTSFSPARTAGQFALGVAEATPVGIATDIASAVTTSKVGRDAATMRALSEELENIGQRKYLGIADEEDDAREKEIVSVLKGETSPEKYAPTIKGGAVKDIAEAVTGEDLEPRNLAESAARFTGWIKDPKKFASLGVTPKEIVTNLFPTATEALRGTAAATATAYAKAGGFGPIGQIAAAIVGDLGTQGAIEFFKNPKKLAATIASIRTAFTPQDKLDLQKKIIKEFQDQGITSDLGTKTDSNLARMVQARLAASSFTGKKPHEFKAQLTEQILDQYKEIAESLGTAKFETRAEAGEVIQETLKSIRETDRNRVSEIYNKASELLPEKAFVRPDRIADKISKIEKSLKPGSLKSDAQRKVLDVLDTIKRDITDASGAPFQADVKDLINTKHAIYDIVDYEEIGGVKSLLKSLAKDVDDTINAYGKENPQFLREKLRADKEFAQHAKTYRNKTINQLLRTENTESIVNKMKSPSGYKKLEKAFRGTPQQEEFDALKRLVLDDMFNEQKIKNVSEQIKLGTFSNIIKSPKNEELLKTMLPKESFNSLEKLSKNAGQLAESANRFLNASQSATVGIDAAIWGMLINDFRHAVIDQNPWPLGKTLITLGTSRTLSNLLFDPEFLRLVDESILASEPASIDSILEMAKPYIESYKEKLSEE